MTSARTLQPTAIGRRRRRRDDRRPGSQGRVRRRSGAATWSSPTRCAAAARSFHHARHESGAICMADGYARVTGRVGVCSVHQGPGLTNTMTGLAEAAKSRTPLLVLAGETPAAALTSNFRIDQHDLVESVGAIADRVHSPRDRGRRRRSAPTSARAIERRPVVLMLPIDIQPQPPDRSRSRPAAAAPAARLRAVRRRDQRGRRPARGTRSGPRSSPAAAPCSPTPARRLERLGRADRRGAGHLGAGQRPVRRPPLRARDLRRLRLPVRGQAAAPGRRRDRRSAPR